MFGRKSVGTQWPLIGAAVAGAAVLLTVMPAVKRRAMKVTNILRKDHRLISGMIMTLEMTPKINGMARKALFSQIRHQLLLHAQAEEDVFYPAVRNLRIGQTESLVNESVREHARIKELLNELSNVDPMRAEFDYKLSDLKSVIQHHVEDEEGKIFPMLERQWTEDQLQQIGRRIHTRKSDLKRQMSAA